MKTKVFLVVSLFHFIFSAIQSKFSAFQSILVLTGARSAPACAGATVDRPNNPKLQNVVSLFHFPFIAIFAVYSNFENNPGSLVMDSVLLINSKFYAMTSERGTFKYFPNYRVDFQTGGFVFENICRIYNSLLFYDDASPRTFSKEEWVTLKGYVRQFYDDGLVVRNSIFRNITGKGGGAMTFLGHNVVRIESTEFEHNRAHSGGTFFFLFLFSLKVL
jgi:hypothetical protein